MPVDMSIGIGKNLLTHNSERVQEVTVMPTGRGAINCVGTRKCPSIASMICEQGAEAQPMCADLQSYPGAGETASSELVRFVPEWRFQYGKTNCRSSTSIAAHRHAP